MNLDTLQYWHKLEHFYPYILEEQRNEKIKTYNIEKEANFPDFNSPDLPPNMEVRYYEVYLGLFKVDSALKVLAQKMNVTEQFHDEDECVSCFCKFRLDSSGGFDKTSFKTSSFPWAIQRVSEGGINIKEWDADFQSFQRNILKRFFQTQNVITYEILEKILYGIQNDISWKIKFDDYWMRIDRVIGERTKYNSRKEENDDITEENEKIDELIKANDLLNSFYVRDIEKINNAIIRKNYGQALDDYIKHQNDDHFDVETNTYLLFRILDPQNMPMGKWPSGYPLRAMQQVAVNIAICDNLKHGNIFSVNGPPGTGKTTLLRDIIAANIVNRAEKLLQFKKPNDAFTDAIDCIDYKGYSNKVRVLKENLNTYGILVASNNNAAVQNITMELPLQDAIAEKYRNNYHYFSEVSDSLVRQKTWGLCAAKLGNKRNCNDFIDKFWPIKKDNSDEYNLNHYLTNTTKKTEDCIANWKEAKNRFSQKYNEVKQEYNNLQKCYNAYKENEDLLFQISKEKEKFSSLELQLQGLQEELIHTQSKIDTIKQYIKQKEEQKISVRKNITFFTIKYIFNHGINDYLILEQDIRSLLKEKGKLENTVIDKKIEIQAIEKQVNKQKKQISEINDNIAKNRHIWISWVTKYDCIVPTVEYLSELTGLHGKDARKQAQSRNPWNYEKLIQLREELFLEAMQLHKAFVENSSYMRDQLDAFGKLLRNQIPSDKAEKLATPLIQNFQLMVPVISTTFASVGSFLSKAGKDTFGLLLIDEAGQALPQSAVGAIWRSKRCVVVGDPSQIEPVVTIHEKTIEFLKDIFSQSDFIASKDTSVQSLADCCNPYGAWRENEYAKYWVGSPLLVHGRCQKTVFNISNRIAYNEKMIYGTKDCDNPICQWIHVVGNSTYKHFVEQQAKAILPLITEQFQKAWEQDKDAPSLFIITPFRSVKTKLIEYFIKTDKLYDELQISNNKDEQKKVNTWGYSNIGTIHTFQGKEAKTVILCLGGDSGTKNDGAIRWASEKPNILNVAVTRAKENLYIVGDANKWSRQPYFDTAYKLCDKQ